VLKDKFPEDGGVLALTLFLDLLNSILRDAAFLGIYDNIDYPSTCDAYRDASSSELLDETLEKYRKATSGNGLAGILIFVLLLIPLLLVLAIISISYIISLCSSSTKSRDTHYSPLITIITKCCLKTDLGDHSHMSYIAGISQWFLVTLYFVGDNLGPAHGGDIGCTGKCSENAALITKVISVGSILLLHFIPYFLKHCVKLIDTDDWEYVLDKDETLLGLLGNIIKVDAAYTALTGLTIVSNFCSDTEHGLNWTLLAFCSIAGAIYITVKMINSKSPKFGIKPIAFGISVGIFLTFLIFFYLTSDNDTPLDCAFHCNDGGPSSRDLSHPLLDHHCCNIRTNVVTRLAFTCIATAQTIVVIALVGVALAKAQRNAARGQTEASRKSDTKDKHSLPMEMVGDSNIHTSTWT